MGSRSRTPHSKCGRVLLCRQAWRVLLEHLALAHMGAVFFVVGTVGFENVAVGQEIVRNVYGEWAGVELGVVEGRFNIEMPEVAAAVTFDNFQGFAVRAA